MNVNSCSLCSIRMTLVLFKAIVIFYTLIKKDVVIFIISTLMAFIFFKNFQQILIFFYFARFFILSIYANIRIHLLNVFSSLVFEIPFHYY